MDYAEHRRRQTELAQNHDCADFTWEVENCPILHSGFIQPLEGQSGKSTLFFSLWFTQGHYQCKVLDRYLNEKAFARVTSLQTIWSELEQHLIKADLDWSEEKKFDAGTSFR